METAISEESNTVLIAFTHHELHIVADPLEEAIKVSNFMNLPLPDGACEVLSKLQIAHDAITMKGTGNEDS